MANWHNFLDSFLVIEVPEGCLSTLVAQHYRSCLISWRGQGRRFLAVVPGRQSSNWMTREACLRVVPTVSPSSHAVTHLESTTLPEEDVGSLWSRAAAALLPHQHEIAVSIVMQTDVFVWREKDSSHPFPSPPWSLLCTSMDRPLNALSIPYRKWHQTLDVTRVFLSAFVNQC